MHLRETNPLFRHAKLCLAAILVHLSFLSFAQSSYWYLSSTLNDNNGLPQNSVGSIYFDHRTAYLWMTTEAGLVRYDGVNTRVFDSRDLPSLTSIRMLRLFKTIHNELMACTREGEVFEIKDDPIDKVLVKNIDVAIFGLLKGNVGSIETPLMQPELFAKFLRPTNLGTHYFWISNHDFWAVADKQVGLFSGDKLVHLWEIESTSFNVLIERNGLNYVLNRTGTGYCINRETKEIRPAISVGTPFTSGNPILYYDRLNDQPLLLSGNKVYDLQFDSQKVTANEIAVLPDSPTYVTSILRLPDKKTIIVSTNTTGVHIYRKSPFVVYKAPGDDALNNNYATVLTDSNHLLTCRLLLFNLRTGAARVLPVAVSHDRSMGIDTFQNVWSVTEDRIIVFNPAQPGRIFRPPMLDHEFLLTSYLAGNKKLWICTDKALGYTTGTEITRIIRYNNEALALYFLAENKQGSLVGVNKKGIYSVDTAQKTIKPIVVSDQLTQIRTIHIDSDNFIWICTYGEGIFVYDPATKKLVKLPLDDKGYLLYSHVFVEDGYGNFLVPTNKGLFRLGKNNLLQIIRDPSVPLNYQYFDVHDGLLTNEFNGGCQPAYNRIPGGDVILPALQGLVRVKIKELPAPVAYPMRVDLVETKTYKYRPGKTELHFSKDERVQTWQVSVAQWDQPNRQGISYRVDDDPLWQRPRAGERNIQLSELTGGSHRLAIRYQYGLLPNQFSSLQFSFYIEKRFYETTWFWLAVLAALVLGIYALIRYRGARLKLKNKQLQEIIRQNTKELHTKNADLEETLLDLNEALNSLKENSIFKNRLIGVLGHDMLVPLRFIANISAHLHNHAGNLTPETARESSGEIKNTAEELLFLGESLLQWIKLLEGSFKLIVRNINMQQLVNEIVSVHKPVMAVKKNTVICNLSPGSDCIYDPVFLKVILHNLLLNANKFTSNGTITITTSVCDNHLTVGVADTGTGMDPSIVSSLNNHIPVASNSGTHKETGWGMGYILIIDLLRFAQGTLNVQSQAGVGSVVTFQLPLQLALD